MSTGGAPGTVPVLSDELRTIAVLCRVHSGFSDLLKEVAARQPRSRQLHQRAASRLSNLPSQVPFTAPLFPICVERASGARVTDVDGNEYVDCHMAYTASILGHNPPEVLEAVRVALDRGVGAGAFVPEHVELAEVVHAMVPSVERVAVFHSGTEAVAASARLARAATGRAKVAKFEGCYHGWSELGVHNPWMLLAGRVPDGPIDAITPAPSTGGVPPGASADLVILPFGSPAAFERIVREASSLAAVVVDPVPPFAASAVDRAGAWLRDLRDVTRDAGVPLVLDEVVSGFRLAPGGAQERFGVHADAACYGKITSGLGLPLTLVAGTAALLDQARTDGLFQDHRAGKAWVSTTNGANFLCVVAALAQLRLVAERHAEIVATLDRNHDLLASALAEMGCRWGLPLALAGNSRLQSSIVLHEMGPPTLDYRERMLQTSTSELFRLVALTFALRLEGVFALGMPTMNLSAAHTEDDVAFVVAAVERALARLHRAGLL